MNLNSELYLKTKEGDFIPANVVDLHVRVVDGEGRIKMYVAGTSVSDDQDEDATQPTSTALTTAPRASSEDVQADPRISGALAGALLSGVAQQAAPILEQLIVTLLQNVLRRMQAQVAGN